MAPYDLLGNIALVKFDRDSSRIAKQQFAVKLLKTHNSVTTVLEKIARIKGRLRTPTTKWIAGVKTKEVLYRENGCAFRFNVDSCYFSPRLSEERKNMASVVRKGERVLVMFGGVGVFAVVMGKTCKPREVVSVELGREPHRYALDNVKRNKLINVQCMQGDVRRVVPKLDGLFDRILMARPNLSDSFLDIAFNKIRAGGIIHYHGFYHEDEIDILKALICEEAHKMKKKIKILRTVQAGDIGVRKYRYRVDIKVLS